MDLAQTLLGIASTGTPTPELPSPLPEFSFGKLCPEAGKVAELLVQGGGGYFDRDLEPHRRFGEIVVTWEPSALPLRLFHLKNGDGSQRQRFERICRMFEMFAPGRRLDVSLEAVVQSNGPPQPTPPYHDAPEQPPTQPGPEFAIIVMIGEGAADDAWELPVTLTGAGLWEALVLAEAIADSDDRLVILEEPALNLHPAWQRLLVARVRGAPGQFLVVTHSPYLVPIDSAEDLAGLVRLARSNGATTLQRYRSAADDATPADRSSRIIREFSLSADARSLLFATGAVLDEGETELGALPLWFEQSETARTLGTPGQLHLGFFSVGGEKHFTPVLALLVALWIPWVIVCDGGPFRPGMGDSHIFRQVLNAGARDDTLRAFVETRLGANDTDLTFEKIITVGRDHGDFTLAPDGSEPTRRTASSATNRSRHSLTAWLRASSSKQRKRLV